MNNIGFFLLLVLFSLPTLADDAILTEGTRFGPVRVVKDIDRFGTSCCGSIRFKSDSVSVRSSDELHGSLEGSFQTREGDILVFRFGAGVRRMPDQYFVLLVTETKLFDLTDHDRFATQDGTFSSVQRGNDIYFDLGFENKKKKVAIYKGGILYIGLDARNLPSGLEPKDCSWLYSQALDECLTASPCTDKVEFSLSTDSGIRALEDDPGFSPSRLKVPSCVANRS